MTKTTDERRSESFADRAATIPRPVECAPWSCWIEVQTAGRIQLPPALAVALRVGPGALFAIQPLRRRGVLLRLYDDLLAVLPGLSVESRWSLVETFLRRPLTALGPDGALALPRELLALRRGQRLLLEADDPHLWSRTLYLLRARP